MASKVLTATGAGVGKTSDYITLDGTASIDGVVGEQPVIQATESLTISGWYYLTDGSISHPGLFCTDVTLGSILATVSPDGDGTDWGATLQFFPDNGGLSWVQSTSNPSLNAWHHYCGIWDRASNTFKIYIDGVEQTPYTPSVTPSPTSIGVGASLTASVGQWNGMHYLIGRVGNLRIFNVALTPGQVADEYALGYGYTG